MKIDRTGESKTNIEGYKMRIIGYRDCMDIDIEFDNGIVLYNRQYSSFKKGTPRNPFSISAYSIGYLGALQKCNSYVKSYWKGVLERGYSKKYKLKYPTYTEVTVDKRWHNFQNFAQWFEQNYNHGTMEGWHLDKDILVKGNKTYSPETCCFVPSEINSLFTKRQKKDDTLPRGIKRNGKKFISYIGRDKNKVYLGTFNTVEEAFQAYKIAKERYIKEVADKWRGQIAEQVYQALYNYQVEITD